MKAAGQVGTYQYDEKIIREVFLNDTYLGLIEPSKNFNSFLNKFNRDLETNNNDLYNVYLDETLKPTKELTNYKYNLLIKRTSKLVDALIKDKSFNPSKITVNEAKLKEILTESEISSNYLILTNINKETISSLKDLNLINDNNLDNLNYYQTNPLKRASLVKYDETLINGLVYILMLFLFIPLMYKEFIYDGKLFLKKPAHYIYNVIGGVVILFMVAYFTDFITKLLELIFSYQVSTSANQASIELMLRSKSAPFMYIAAILCAPIIEELVFRKTFFNLNKSKGLILYTSSLVFGLIHVITEITNPVAMLINLVPYFLAGLALGVIYLLNKKNIYVTILVHMIWNTLSFII